MSLFSLLLILAAAVCHATWNLLAKGAKDTVAFSWAFAAAAVVLMLPVAVITLFWTRPSLGAEALLLVTVSAALHLAYFLLLGAGYRTGDLSLVYPLARGTGPLLATIAAIVLLGERPSLLGLAGAALVIGGVLLMAVPSRLRLSHESGAAAGYALATGACIALYTLWDKRGVSVVPPILYSYGIDFVRMLLLTPVAAGTAPRRRAIAAEWRARPLAVVAVALLSSVAYILVLTALAISSVSYVAPAREVSILLGALFGARLLREGHATRRLLGASGIVAGVVALAVG